MSPSPERAEIWALIVSGGCDPGEMIVRLKWLALAPESADIRQAIPLLTTDDWQIFAAVVRILEAGVCAGVFCLEDVFPVVPEPLLARVGQHLAYSGSIRLEQFVEALGCGDAMVRRGALSALSAHPRRTLVAVGGVHKCLESDDEHEIALATIALSRMGDRSVHFTEAVKRQLKHPSCAVRHMSALALLETRPPQWEELPALRAALADAPEPLVLALGEIMDEYGLPLQDIFEPTPTRPGGAPR